MVKPQLSAPRHVLPQGKEFKLDCECTTTPPISSAHTTADPSLIDRWYDVYDRNVRPGTAHHPDMAQRFKVPEHIAVWNTSAGSSEMQPSDRLDLAQLKAAVGVGMTNMTPGQYTSLPLDGRVDLIMPKPKPGVLHPPIPLPRSQAQTRRQRPLNSSSNNLGFGTLSGTLRLRTVNPRCRYLSTRLRCCLE